VTRPSAQPFSHAHLLHDEPTPGPCGAANPSFSDADLLVDAPLPAKVGTAELAFREPQ
jgi:hypothetical protein